MDPAVLLIGDEERATLESWTRSRAIRASHVQRARIIFDEMLGVSATLTVIGVLAVPLRRKRWAFTTPVTP